MPKYYSKTGKQHGAGSDRYKWVSGLTKDEIKKVDSGKNVFIKGCPTHGGNPPERVVRRIKGRLVPRVYRKK